MEKPILAPGEKLIFKNVIKSPRFGSSTKSMKSIDKSDNLPALFSKFDDITAHPYQMPN